MTTTPYTVEAWRARALAAEADADRLRELGLQYAYQSGLYARRMTEAQAARDRLRAELEALRDELLSAYSYVVQHPGAFDHACERCVGRGEIVIDGFVCTQHLAADALDAARSQHSEGGV